jgi:ankyrin repeat protein
MKSLLKKDADANNARSDGISALMTASVGGHVEAAKLLLENGADARFADGEGVTVSLFSPTMHFHSSPIHHCIAVR